MVSAFFRISLPNKQKIMSLLQTSVFYFSASAFQWPAQWILFMITLANIRSSHRHRHRTKTRSTRWVSVCGWFNMHEPQQMCKNLNEFISAFLSIVKSSQIIFSLVAHFFGSVFSFCYLFWFVACKYSIAVFCAGHCLFCSEMIQKLCILLFQFTIRFPLAYEIGIFVNGKPEKEKKSSRSLK